MKVILRPHLKIRLKERLIPESYPGKIISKPDAKYFDTATNHQVAIKELAYNGKLRPMVVAYDIIEKDLQVITVHPASNQEIKNKVLRGRWVRYEKN